MVGNTRRAKTKPNESEASSPNTKSMPARLNSSRRVTPPASAPKNASPGGRYSTRAPNATCSPNAAPTTRQLTARRCADNSQASAGRTRTPIRPIKSFVSDAGLFRLYHRQGQITTACDNRQCISLNSGCVELHVGRPCHNPQIQTEPLPVNRQRISLNPGPAESPVRRALARSTDSN